MNAKKTLIFKINLSENVKHISQRYFHEESND